MNMAGMKYGLGFAESTSGCSQPIQGAWWGDHHRSERMPIEPEHVAYEFEKAADDTSEAVALVIMQNFRTQTCISKDCSIKMYLWI